MSLMIQQFEVGPMENFVYLIGDSETREAVVVDAAWELDTIFKKAAELGLKIVGALVTHHHFDHTNGLPDLLERQEMPIYLNEHDAEFMKIPKSSLTRVKGGDELQVGNVTIRFLHTPGHTPGSQCFWVQNSLVSGDTLFINGCGRCDLPGGNVEQMYDTLANKLMKLPDETVLYPGHNYAPIPKAFLGDQKHENLYLRLAAGSLKDFLKLRMG